MREVIRETGKILLLALIEELVRNLFPDYVVWAWMLALTYLTYELLRWKRIKKAGTRSRERLSQGQNMWAYFVVAIFGAFLFIAFWYGVNKVYGRYTKILATKETKKESSQKEQAEVQSSPLHSEPDKPRHQRKPIVVASDSRSLNPIGPPEPPVADSQEMRDEQVYAELSPIEICDRLARAAHEMKKFDMNWPQPEYPELDSPDNVPEGPERDKARAKYYQTLKERGEAQDREPIERVTRFNSVFADTLGLLGEAYQRWPEVKHMGKCDFQASMKLGDADVCADSIYAIVRTIRDKYPN